MAIRRERLIYGWVLLAIFLSVGLEAAAESRAADERAALQRVRASHLAATGRCEEAIRLASALADRDAATELMLGKCAIQAQQYGRALEALDRAKALDPDTVGVELYRGIALYHLEDYTASGEALANARAVDEEAALLEFYQGLLFLRNDQPRESALAFERAAARGPELVEPVASYYAALAWQSLNENEPLDGAVARVREEDPDGAWADEADKLVELQAERFRGGQTGLQRWFGARVGVEYDDNVTLSGGDGEFRIDLDGSEVSISREEDYRTVWSAVLGAELFEIDEWTFGSQLSYAGNAHDDLDDFDQHYLALTSWVDREIRATTFARGLLTAGAGWIDNDPYLYHLTLGGLIEERWGRPGTTRCQLDIQLNDYRYDLPVIEENRKRVDQDGVEVRAGCEHELPLTFLLDFEPSVYGGYQFSSYFANGSSWDHIANRIHLGLLFELPFEIDVDARGTYTRRDFEHASYYAEVATRGPDRNDDALHAQVSFVKELTSFLDLEARYEYLDNGSNTEVFDFKRHIAGLYLELELR